MVLTKNPYKLEARAQGYEQRGKAAKALKCRQKIARLTGLSPIQQTGYGSPLMGQQTFVGQQPLMGGQTLLGQQTGFPLQQQGLVGQQTGLLGQQGLTQQTGLLGQQGLAHNHGLIGQQGVLGQQQFVGQPQVLTAGGPMINAPFAWNTTNTPARYEQNALKWENRGNYMKANKNRGKVWRLQNPQFATVPAVPNFYNNNQFLGYNQTVPVAAAAAVPMTAATTVETITRPTIVQETMRPERIVEVQPIVHREIDAPQVKVIEQHIYENVPSQGPSTITNAPIIQETVRPKIIEEIQPVVHREVPAPFVERVEQHVTEHIVQPTTTTKEVINGGTMVGQPFVAAGGVPLTQQTTTTTTTTQQGGLMGKVNNVLHRNQQQL